MSFANAIMAFGAAAFVVPLAIHLLFRSRYRTLDWGAMFLLQDVVNANRRRMQWHQWILLALRCAIPILLALAMARPAISWMQSMTGSAPVSLILLIDDSRSMSAANRSTVAIDGATELLDSMSRRDEVILIPTSRVAAPVTIGSPADAREELRTIRFDGAPMSMQATLQAATAACREASNPYRRIVIVSDFQENTLQAGTDGSATSLLGSVDSISERLDQFKPRPQLDFLDVANMSSDEAALANVLVESIGVDAPAILVDRSVPVTATIRNDSELPVTNLLASWMVDGRVLETETMSLEPQGTARLNWQTTFERTGGVSIGLFIEHADAIAADNRRESALEVLRPIRVWLVDGQPSTEPLQSETDFLKVALSPFAFRVTDRDQRADNRAGNGKHSDSRRDVVSTQVISESTLLKQLAELNAEKNANKKSNPIETPDLIVLANVSRPPGTSRRAQQNPDTEDPIAAYLANGGRVLFFDGDQIDVEAWTQCAWLPVAPGEIIASESTPYRIEPPGARLAAWQSLGSSEDSLFDSVEITKQRQLGQISENASATVLLRTESGALLAISKAITTDAAVEQDAEQDAPSVTAPIGRVVQFAIPCDTAWSNLPLRPVYLPMIQQLVLDMVGSDRGGSVLPGTTLVIQPNRVPGEPTDADATWQVTTPTDRTQSLPTSIHSPLVYNQTSEVGAYRFHSKVAAETETQPTETPSDEPVVVRVVDVPAAESDLRAVAPELLAECSERLGATSYADSSGLVAAAQRDRFGMEIWRPLLWLLLAFMITEILWQQIGVTRAASRFAGSKPQPKPQAKAEVAA